MIVPLQSKTAFIYPYLGDGFTKGGIWVQFDERLPPVLGVILATSNDCEHIKPGDNVVFRPYAYEVCSSTQGDIAVIKEEAIAAILEPDNE